MCAVQARVTRGGACVCAPGTVLQDGACVELAHFVRNVLGAAVLSSMEARLLPALAELQGGVPPAAAEQQKGGGRE